MFDLIGSVCAEQGKPLDPGFVHCDCEPALINSSKSIFQNALIRLCRFHVVDAIRRHGNGNGLRPIINKNSAFKRFYHQLRQIFFFPIREWPRIWHLILNAVDLDTRSIPAVAVFLDYLVRLKCERKLLHGCAILDCYIEILPMIPFCSIE